LLTWALAPPAQDGLDPSMAYLMSLQRSMAKQPVNVGEQRNRFCAELEQTYSEMKASDVFKRLGGAKGSPDSCDQLLAAAASTPYERADFVWLRNHIEPRVQAAIAALDKNLPAQPVIGTLPVGFLNAKVIQPPGGGRPLIVLNDEVFRLPYEVARASVRALGFDTASNGIIRTSVDRRDIAARVAAHPDVTSSLEWAVLRYLHLISGPPDDGYPSVESKLDLVINIRLLEGLTDAMEVFIMSHEFAHLILRHTPGSPSGLNLQAAGSQPVTVNEAAYSWRQELEADAYGFMIMDEVLKKEADQRSGNYLKDPFYPFYLYGPRYFLTIMGYVENASAEVKTGVASPGPSREDVRIAEQAVSAMFSDRKSAPAPVAPRASTHPPFLFRAKQAELIEQKALSLFLDKAELPSGTGSVYRFSEAFGAASAVLLETAAPDFIKRYREKSKN